MARSFLIPAAVFLLLQASVLDYGCSLNDLPHVAAYSLDKVAGTALEQNAIVAAQNDAVRDRNWPLRFKVYSIEADEAVVLMALARINPARLDFDPHFYQYGGAFLYPLGGFYLACVKAGLMPMPTLDRLVAQPDAADRVYVLGRAFVMVSVLGAAWLLHRACRRLTGEVEAGLLTAVFLLLPATLMFSIVIKPHWYSLLFICLALERLTKALKEGRLGLRDELLLAVGLGLAVGAVSTNALFAALVWAVLCALAWGGQAPRLALLRVPLVAVACHLASNPYVLLNREAFLAEASMTSGWYGGSSLLQALGLFFSNSFFQGFGLAFGGLALGLAATLLARPGRWRGAALLLLAPLPVIALLTTAIGFWHTNFRYLPYFLPAAALLLAARPFAGRRAALAVVLLLSVAQSAPLLAAYRDENDPARSTRLAAMEWFHANVPEGAAICVGNTPAPYSVPPLDLRRYRITDRAACDWLVEVEREPGYIVQPPQFAEAARFAPRLTGTAFPLVFSHINPLITVHRRTDSPGQ